MFDAHSHFASPDALVCSADALLPSGPALRRGIGALAGGIGLDDATAALIEKALKADPSLMVGEVGLDRRFTDRVPAAVQRDFLRRSCSLARFYGRPVILHCVRMYGELLSVIREFPDVRFMVHGFSGSDETGRELVRNGVLVSLRPGFPARLEGWVRSCPGKWVAESDFTGTDAALYNEVLAENYRRLAGLLGTDTDRLEEICRGASEVFADFQTAR